MSWSAQPERGSAWLARTAVFVAQRGGWHVGRACAVPATAWFVLTSRQARAASRDYLGRALGRPAGWVDVVRHFDSFATVVLDRVMLLCGRHEDYRITVDGLDELLAVVAEGRGCILIGAHLGSFEVLRTLAQRAPVPVWALMYRRNGRTLTTMLDRLAPALRAQVLEIGDTASMIQARECVERGEIVGLLADRAPLGHPTVPAAFLGGTAHFPSGPFVLASLLGAPVFTFRGVRTGTRRYHVSLALFDHRVVLRRASRAADLGCYVQRYAAALERACRAHPLQWFNFFPFWEHDDAKSAQPAAPPPADPVIPSQGR
ncbi:MAG: acyl-CoA synthetase [Janthinobacterium lividum]